MSDFPEVGRNRSKGWKRKIRTVFQMLEENIPSIGKTWPRRSGRAGRCTAEGRNRRKAKPITNRSLLPAGEPVRRRRVAAISGVGLWRIRHSPELEWWLAAGRRIFRIREDSSTSAVSPAGRGVRIPESGCFAGSRRVPRYLLKAGFRFGGIQGNPVFREALKLVGPGGFVRAVSVRDRFP